MPSEPQECWDLPDKHLEHGNSLIRPRMWPGKQKVIAQPPMLTRASEHRGGSGGGGAIERGGDFHSFLHTPRKGQPGDEGAKVGKEGTLLRTSQGARLKSLPATRQCIELVQASVSASEKWV